MFNRVFVECEGSNQFYQSLGRKVISIHEVPQDATKEDLIVLSGGVDINPSLYGELPHPRNQVQSRELGRRDKLCVELWNFAKSNYIPLLGICRGAQHIAAMKGIKLIQDLPEADRGRRQVRLEGKFWASVPKCHHQAVPMNDILTCLGESSIGGLSFMEAFETDGHVLGVQGHPEWANHFEEFPNWVRNKLWSMK